MGGVFGSTVHLQTVVCSTFLGPLLPSRDVKAFLDVLVRQPIVNNTMEPINKLFFVVLSGEVQVKLTLGNISTILRTVRAGDIMFLFPRSNTEYPISETDIAYGPYKVSFHPRAVGSKSPRVYAALADLYGQFISSRDYLIALDRVVNCDVRELLRQSHLLEGSTDEERAVMGLLFHMHEYSERHIVVKLRPTAELATQKASSRIEDEVDTELDSDAEAFMGIVMQGTVVKLRADVNLNDFRRTAIEAAQFNTVKFSTSERLQKRSSTTALEIKRVYRKPEDQHQEGIFDYSQAGEVLALGACFGEERCLLPEKFTTHNIVSCGESVLGCIYRSGLRNLEDAAPALIKLLRRNLGLSYMAKLRDKVPFFERSELDPQGNSNIYLAERLRYSFVKAGHVLSSRGTALNGVSILVSGSLRLGDMNEEAEEEGVIRGVTRGVSRGVSRDEELHLSPGDYFGDECLLSGGGIASYSVTASEPSLIIVIDETVLHKVFARSSHSEKLAELHVIAARERSTLEDLLRYPASCRAFESFLEGSPSHDGLLFWLAVDSFEVRLSFVLQEDGLHSGRPRPVGSQKQNSPSAGRSSSAVDTTLQSIRVITDAGLLHFADDILKRYILIDSPCQINISSTLRGLIEASFHRWGDLADTLSASSSSSLGQLEGGAAPSSFTFILELFAEAKVEMAEMLRKDALSRWRESLEFQGFFRTLASGSRGPLLQRRRGQGGVTSVVGSNLS